MSDDMAMARHSRKYLLVVLLPVAELLVIFATFNTWVDPYALRGYDTGQEGFNDQKPHAYNQDRLHKTHAVIEQQPEVLLLGTSRVGMGISPHHAAFGDRRAYNFGMTGASAYEIWRSYQHCQAVAPVEEVLLGLDFFMFDALSQPPPTFAEERLRVHPSGNLQLSSFYHDYPPALWSSDATFASIDTIRESRRVAHRDGRPVARYDQGLFDDSPWEPALQKTGHAVQFWLREKDFLWSFLDFRYQDRRGDNRQLDALAKLLRQLHRDEVTTQIFIPPIHARMMLVIYESQLWEVWRNWKLDVARINAEVAAELGREPFPFWDFASVNEFSSEAVPELWDTKTRMQWYWEGSHFKVSLGDQVLNRIYQRPEAEDLPPEFGLRLDDASLATAALERIDQQMADFRRDNEELVDDIANRVRILLKLKAGTFDVDQLDPEVRKEVETQMRLLQGR